MKDLGIDLNGVDNGIWLPVRSSGYLNGFTGSLHNGRSNGNYIEYVDSYLDQSTDIGDARARLSDLKRWLTNGCLPINTTEGSGVVRKPASGTCPDALVTYFRNRGVEVEAS